MLTGGMNAEFGFGTGGVLNVVTKSGGNSFSGTFDARYRDQKFNESGEHYDPDEDDLLQPRSRPPPSADRSCATGCGSSRRSSIRSSEDTPVGAPRTTVRYRTTRSSES